MGFVLECPRLADGEFLQTVVEKGAIDCPPNFGGRGSRRHVMPPSSSHILPIRRIKKRKDFLRVAQKGQKSAVPGLVLQILHWRNNKPKSPTSFRIGFTVTKKIGNAIMRNRTRRRLKAAALNVMAVHARENTDYVLIGRASTLKRPFKLLVADLERAMQKLNVYRN